MTSVYPYPPRTPGADSKDGNYYHKLSPANLAALKVCQTWYTTNKIDVLDLCLDCIHPDLILLRYLRAFKFNATKAINSMTKNIQWRKEQNVKGILTRNPEAILGVKMDRLTAIFPHWHSGYDKTGRPVLYKVYGGFDAKKIKAMFNGSFDNLVNYHIWEQETCTKLCLQQSHKLGQIVETCTAVMDIKDMVMSQISRSFLGLTKRLAAVDQEQYPETLGRIIIINAPSAFPMAWRMVKGFLDPVVTSKITVCGGPAEWEPILFDLIGRENLPSNYGGLAPAVTNAVHPYAESMAGFVPTAEDADMALKLAASVASPTKTDVDEDEEEVEVEADLSDLKIDNSNGGSSSSDLDISFASELSPSPVPISAPSTPTKA